MQGFPFWSPSGGVTLVDELVESMLSICARFSPHNGPGVVVHSCPVVGDVLSIWLHVTLDVENFNISAKITNSVKNPCTGILSSGDRPAGNRQWSGACTGHRAARRGSLRGRSWCTRFPAEPAGRERFSPREQFESVCPQVGENTAILLFCPFREGIFFFIRVGYRSIIVLCIPSSELRIEASQSCQNLKNKKWQIKLALFFYSTTKNFDL